PMLDVTYDPSAFVMMPCVPLSCAVTTPDAQARLTVRLAPTTRSLLIPALRCRARWRSCYLLCLAVEVNAYPAPVSPLLVETPNRRPAFLTFSALGPLSYLLPGPARGSPPSGSVTRKSSTFSPCANACAICATSARASSPSLHSARTYSCSQAEATMRVRGSYLAICW